MLRLVLFFLLLSAVAVSGAPLPRVEFELGDVPPHIRDDAQAVWEEHAPVIQAKLWPYVRAPQPVSVRLMDSEAYAEWTSGWLGDWTVGAAGADWIALDVQRLRAVGQTLEHVLIHEYAHCLIRQGAGERADVPRWFHEGVAQHVAREWRMGDTVSLILDGGVPDLRTLDQGLGGAVGADAFYRASLLAALRLEDRYGPDVFRDLILALRATGGFETAFVQVTGESYGVFVADFGGSVKLRYGWLFLITRWPTLFVVASLIFLLGAMIKRRRNLQQIEGMADEEGIDPSVSMPTPRSGGNRLWPASDPDKTDRPH